MSRLENGLSKDALGLVLSTRRPQQLRGLRLVRTA